MYGAFIRAAVDDPNGKPVRNIVNDVVQPDGTTLSVYQQVITRAMDDGTVLDSTGFGETGQQAYMRRLSEQILEATQAIAAAVGGSFSLPIPPTVIPGE